MLMLLLLARGGMPAGKEAGGMGEKGARGGGPGPAGNAAPRLPKLLPPWGGSRL